MPVNQPGGPTAVELIQQSFNPAVAVLASPDVDIVCSKNRLTFVELLQPFSRLSVEGQVRDHNHTLHSINNFRLSVRDISWKPASAVLARRLLSDAVSNYNSVESFDIIEVNPNTPWYDSWKETLWGCLEWTEHDFTRHYLGTLLVVSSSHPNPMEQFHQLNDQLMQLTANNGLNDGPRWFNSSAVRYFVLLHDALEGETSKAEEIFQSMRTQYGTHGCHLLVINSKPKKVTNGDPALPAPDPWLRFLPRKNSKRPIWRKTDFLESEPTDALDNGSAGLPSIVNEQSTEQTSKIPLMDALQEAMQEINIQSILPPSASTLALSLLASDQQANAGVSHRSAVEITADPLNANSGSSSVQFVVGSNDSDGMLNDSEVHGGCLTADDLDRIQSLINEFCLKSLLPHMERQIRILNEATSSRKSTHRSLFSATKRWFGSAKPGSQPPQTIAVSYQPESTQLQIRRLGDLAFLLGMYDLAYTSYHTAKKDFEADQAWLHYAGALEMAALSVFLQSNGTQSRNIPFHYFDTALTTYLQTCKMPQWATRCVVIASECLKTSNHFSEAALQLVRLVSEDADLRSAVLLEQAALCFLRSTNKSGQSEPAKPNSLPLVRKYAFHMILAGHRFGKSGQKRHASRAYQLALQVYRGHGWSLAEDHIHYTVGRQCLSNQQIDAACQAFGALLKQGSLQTAAQQTAYLNEFIHVNQLLAKQNRETKSLPILPIPVVDGNHIRVLVEARDANDCEPGVTEAANVTFADDEAHHSKWSDMEEQLVKCAFESTTALPKATNVLFTETTNNMHNPQSFCDELISVEVPLTNPMRIPIYLSDIRLLWHFAGADGNLSSLTAAVDNPLVTAYAAPGVILNPASSNKTILYIKPQAEGLLTIEGISFALRPANVDPATPGATTMNGRVMFSVRGPRLNASQKDKQKTVYAPDKRLLIQVGARMPRLRVLLHSLPEFLLSGEIRPVKVELSSFPLNLSIGQILVATNDPRMVALELPLVEKKIDDKKIDEKKLDDEKMNDKKNNKFAVYRWDPLVKSTNMWIRGAEEVGLAAVDLLFFYDSPTIAPKLLRHSSKIFVSSSLSVNAWVQQVPSAQLRAPTISLQVQVQNLRDVDDTSLSGIEIKQVNLLNDKWEIRPELCSIPDGLLHPQESVFCVILATQSTENKSIQSVALHEKQSVNFEAEPYSSLVKLFRTSPDDLLLVLTWSATQASEDGFGTVSIHGQHYLLKSIQETASLAIQPGNEISAPCFVTYSMEFEPTVSHDFTQQRMCIVSVVLYLHNSSDNEVLVNYSANYDAAKSPRATQLYMPEAASPLLWLGRVEGQLSVNHTSDPIKLSVAVTRPGVYSLAQGLHIEARTSENSVKVTSPKLEFTLVVKQKDM